LKGRQKRNDGDPGYNEGESGKEIYSPIDKD